MQDYQVIVSERGVRVSFQKDGNLEIIEFPAPELENHPEGVVCVECAAAHQRDPIANPETGVYANVVEAWWLHTFDKFNRWAETSSSADNDRMDLLHRRPATEKTYNRVGPEDEERGQQTDDPPWYKRDD